MAKIKALIFDFDGLILDTETPDYETWCAIYREHGFELPREEWGKIIGGYGISEFDAAEHLSVLTQGRLDSVSLRDRHTSESYALTFAQPILPGVVDYLQDAKDSGCSSSLPPARRTRGWICTLSASASLVILTK